MVNTVQGSHTLLFNAIIYISKFQWCKWYFLPSYTYLKMNYTQNIPHLIKYDELLNY